MFKTANHTLTWMPTQNNEDRLHPGTQELTSGDIIKRKTRLMNKRHSKQQCEAYHRARRAFDNKGNNADWKAIWEKKYMCKWADFYQRQKIIHYKGEAKRLNLDVAPGDWKTEAWIPILERAGVRVDYKISRDEPKFLENDCLQQRERKEYTPFEFTERQTNMDDVPVDDKCKGDYLPFGGYVDAENTIANIEGTDYGFAKSNPSLVVILRQIPQVFTPHYWSLYERHYEKYHLTKSFDRNVMITILSEPYRAKLVSRQYDGVENGEDEYKFSVKDTSALFKFMSQLMFHYWYKAFSKELDKVMKNTPFPATATSAGKKKAKEEMKKMSEFIKNLVRAQIIEDVFGDSTVTHILTQAQYTVWGQYSLDVEISDAHFNDFFDNHVQPFVDVYNEENDVSPVGPESPEAPAAAAAVQDPTFEEVFNDPNDPFLQDT
jgi:hypothetical protein